MRRRTLSLACLIFACGMARAQDDAARAAAAEKAHRSLDEVEALLKKGKYDEARLRAHDAVALAEKELGPEDEVTSECLGFFGAALERLGKFTEARAAYERALAIDEKAFGVDAAETASNINNVGNVLRAMGDLKGARPFYERSLAIREKRLGAEHAATGVALNNLGTLLWQLGDFGGAKSLMERALAITEKSKGPEHPDTAVTLANLAQLAIEMGDLPEARSRCERALAIQEKALGPDHPETARTLCDLGRILQDLGELQAARADLERALRIEERTVGPDHPDVAATLINLAYVLRSLGEFAQARAHFERALSIREKALGPEHYETAMSMGTLALILEDVGDLKAARPLVERALAIHEKILGPDHPTTAMTLLRLARLKLAMGDRQEALKLHRQALAVFEAKLGPDHPQTALCLNDLGCLLHALGEMTEAKAVLERALAVEEKRLGEGSTEVGGTLQNLATVTAALGDGAKAMALSTRALGIREKALGPDHPAVAFDLTQLALLKGGAGDRAAELSLLGRALAIREKALGPLHPLTAASLANLAISMRAAGDADGARPLFERAWKADLEFLETILPALSARERCEALRQREEQLGRYMFGVSDAPRTTWAAALSWKGAALRGSTGTLRLPAHASEAARRAAEDLSAARRALATLALSPPAIKAGERPIAERYEELRKRVEALERALAEQLPELKATMFPPTGTREAQASIPTGVALLEVLQNDRYVYAWVVRREGEPSFWRLGKAADLDPIARRFREAVERDDAEAWKAAGKEIRSWLAKPLAKALDGSDALCVSPDGVLATIPWGLLPEGEGFLLERSPIFCINGIGGLAGATTPTEKRAARGLLSIGGVDYGGLGGAIPPLPETEAEAGEVARRFKARFSEAPCQVVTGKEASEGAFGRLAPQARYIHVATHGFFDLEGLRTSLAGTTRGLSGKSSAPLVATQSLGVDVGSWNPLLLSGIVLARCADEDGYLTAEELQEEDLRGVELVVLSACETGRGELAAGEGVLGLSRALVVAGARQFLLSLWRVPDAETRELMDGFYAGLWDDALPASEALRRVQLAMLAREREKGLFRPSAWGAWVVTR